MKLYNHIFFDLDHTLWDFTTNVRATLSEIYLHFELGNLAPVSILSFIEIYEKYNLRMWADYQRGKMSKETLRHQRFRQTLWHMGIKDKLLSVQISAYYVINNPKKTGLYPHAKEVLKWLKGNYKLHIITNGFDEIQYTKMRFSGLLPFFDQIITPEIAGARKPSSTIFNCALIKSGAKADSSLMIGDDPLADIIGAAKAGIDGVFFNPEQQPNKVNSKYEISELTELYDIL